MSKRNADRFTLAVVLVVGIGISRGLDTAVVVALSLVVMEVDAHHNPPNF